ncbi:hypothetical protein ACNUIM_32475 [Pseudomonas aeruginosa]
MHSDLVDHLADIADISVDEDVFSTLQLVEGIAAVKAFFVAGSNTCCAH